MLIIWKIKSKNDFVIINYYYGKKKVSKDCLKYNFVFLYRQFMFKYT